MAKTTLRYRLFKIGKMPPTLAQAASGPDVIVAAEGISLRCHGSSIKLPGYRAGSSVNLASGAIVLTQERLLTSFARYVVVDSEILPAGQEPHRVELAADGVRVFPDLPTLFGDAGSGVLELHWRIEIEPSRLASLPSGPASIVLPEQVAPLIRGRLR